MRDVVAGADGSVSVIALVEIGEAWGGTLTVEYFACARRMASWQVPVLEFC
jgi:hypothetical protein